MTRIEWESGSKRSNTDSYLKIKYDVSMAHIALAWHWKKGVASPIVGATKISHLDGAVKALDLELSDSDVIYLEELYRVHEVILTKVEN